VDDSVEIVAAFELLRTALSSRADMVDEALGGSDDIKLNDRYWDKPLVAASCISSPPIDTIEGRSCIRAEQAHLRATNRLENLQFIAGGTRSFNLNAE
jgi:hypothetical protein